MDKDLAKSDFRLAILAIGIAAILAIAIHHGWIGQREGNKLIDATLDTVPTLEAPDATTR